MPSMCTFQDVFPLSVEIVHPGAIWAIVSIIGILMKVQCVPTLLDPCPVPWSVCYDELEYSLFEIPLSCNLKTILSLMTL